MTDAIRIESLRFAYPSPLPDGEPVPALRGIDVSISQGEFVALIGPVGAGKSTLCYALNGAIPHAIDGDFGGRVVVCDHVTSDVAMAQLATTVGLVFESTEAQLFNASVADEVAFGLEGMGLPPAEIEKRIDRALEQVGLVGFRSRSPRSLSGGEQKRLALASVLAMQPQVLVLDEPTSGLDPRGRQQVIQAIDHLRLEREVGMTVVMATQDAEVAARFAGRVIVLRQGRIALSGTPTHVFAQVEQMDEWGLDVPQLARLAHLLGKHAQRSIDFSDTEALRQVLLERSSAPTPGPLNAEQSSRAQLQIRSLSHRYPGTASDALQEVSMEVLQGEWLAIIGVNGSGKSTLIRHLNGLLKPSAGQVHVDGQDTQLCAVGELARTVSYLPQNPDVLIFSATVREEVAYGPRQLGLEGPALEERVTETLSMLDLLDQADHPPAVLSYSVRRQVALASVLAMNTPVLALDEPAVGLDRGSVTALMEFISSRHQQGTTVVMITHDLQLVARYAQRVAVLQQGHLVALGPVHDILADPEQLQESGLEPLPVTGLARSLGWPPPLPLTARDLLPHG